MKRHFAFLAAFYGATVGISAVQKPIFLLYHHALAEGCSWSEKLQVVLHGLFLDCTVAGYLSIPLWLLLLCSILKPLKGAKQLLHAYTVLLSVLIAAIFATDVALYGFWGFRMDATLLFYLRTPREAMASVPPLTAVLQTLFFVLYGGFIYLVYARVLLPHFPANPVRQKGKCATGWLLAGGLLFIPIRGGVTTSTANVGMVYFSQKPFLNHAAINPCFSLLASLGKQQDFAAQFDFFAEEERQAVMQTIMPQENDEPTEQLLRTKRPNILIILLESFSANVSACLGAAETATPCLDRLSQEGVFFPHLYANSFRTDRGIVALLNGYLAQPTTSVMKYPAKSQTLPSIARSLRENGYATKMLYGGDINFTNMQSYFYGSGYQEIVSDRDFPLASRLSKWGAADDVTFRYLCDDLPRYNAAAGTTPWLYTFLTLSSHEPFDVPYHRLEAQGPYPNSVAFTDSCLGHFIEHIKPTPLWQDLLVILVADHGFPHPKEVQNYEPRRYHIPMLWIGGAVRQPKLIDHLCSQTDLAATLLAQLGIDHSPFLFSRNLAQESQPEYAFYTFSNGFGWIDRTGVSVFDNDSNQPLLEQPAGNTSLQRLRFGKALLQTLYDDLGAR